MSTFAVVVLTESPACATGTAARLPITGIFGPDQTIPVSTGLAPSTIVFIRSSTAGVISGWVMT